MVKTSQILAKVCELPQQFGIHSILSQLFRQHVRLRSLSLLLHAPLIGLTDWVQPGLAYCLKIANLWVARSGQLLLPPCLWTTGPGYSSGGLCCMSVDHLA